MSQVSKYATSENHIYETWHYDRTRKEEIIELLPKVLEQYPEFASRKDVPGIPQLDWYDYQVHGSRYRNERRWFEHDKFGRIDMIDASATQFSSSSPLARYVFPLLVPEQPQGWTLTPPTGGYAVWNVETGIATIYTTEDDEEIGDVMPTVTLSPRTPRDLMTAIQAAVTKKGIPVYLFDLYKAGTEHYPWRINKKTIAYATISNEEVSVPLVGYAVDKENQEIVYAHWADIAQNADSILSSFRNGGRKLMTVHTPRGPIQGRSTFNYRPVQRRQCEEDDRIWSVMLVDARCLDEQVNDRSYLLRRLCDEDGKLETMEAKAFARRLNAVDILPYVKEWGQPLMEYGEKESLLRYIDAGGDCFQAFAIERSPHWRAALDALHQQGAGELRNPTPEEVPAWLA